jgi:acetylornithine deacetylase
MENVTEAARHRALAALELDRLLGLLRAMLRFRSFSASQGEPELARWLAGKLRSRSLEVARSPVPSERLNMLGWLLGSGGGPSLMLNGHIDTNMAGVCWGRDPWGADVEDGFVYGLGASTRSQGSGRRASLCAATCVWRWSSASCKAAWR